MKMSSELFPITKFPFVGRYQVEINCPNWWISAFVQCPHCRTLHLMEDGAQYDLAMADWDSQARNGDSNADILPVFNCQHCEAATITIPDHLAFPLPDKTLVIL